MGSVGSVVAVSCFWGTRFVRESSHFHACTTSVIINAGFECLTVYVVGYVVAYFVVGYGECGVVWLVVYVVACATVGIGAGFFGWSL